MPILLYDLVGKDTARPFSPHCWKVAFALAHKGLEFQRVATPFTAIASVEGGFAKIVPVIRDGDRLVSDSFAIATYLEETYPDRASLFGGDGGMATARFVERWVQTALTPLLITSVLMDIHDCLAPEDQAYFRRTREARFGMRLEEAPAGREERLPLLKKTLEPLRSTLAVQPFIGGEGPLFVDYIVAGMFQWVRIVSTFRFLEEGDAVTEWFDRCLALHGGLGSRIPAAA